jgi:menaquinone-dependent protoporphyrinogen oxidase
MAVKKILIAFGTRYGSTEATAKELAKIFEEKGLQAELLDLKGAKEKNWPKITEYDGVIVGTGIKMGKWTNKAKKFLREIKSDLESAGIKLFIYVSCMLCLTDPEKAREDYLNKKIEKYEIKSEKYEAFEPILDFTDESQMGWFAKSIIKKSAQEDLEKEGIYMDYEARNDLRDMEKIKKFAEEIISTI